MPYPDLRLFALEDSRRLGERVAAALGVPLAAHEERDFEDGEHKSRPLENVRGTDAYVICSLYGDDRHSVNDKLVRLLFFIGAVRESGAARVTAITPYLCYSRKDRKTKPRDPVTTRYTASLFEAVGTDCLITLDVHNLAAFQNAFRINTEHLEARPLFIDHVLQHWSGDELVVVSPDVGGIKRAERFRESLEKRLGRPVAAAFMEKKRSGGVVSGEAMVGEVEGRTALIVDDLIAGGTTMARAATACARQGARRAVALATHGVFAHGAGTRLDTPELERVVITDSVPPTRLDPEFVRRRLTVIDSSGLLAEAIRRLHEDGSITELVWD